MSKKKTDGGVAAEEMKSGESTPETISKMEAVRRVLAKDADMKPGDGVAAIKKEFGLDISTGNFSAYKSQIKAKGKESKPAAAKGRGGRPKVATAEASPLDAAQQVKALVDRYGTETVKGLAELFGKGPG
jgi:ribosomal protein S24E